MKILSLVTILMLSFMACSTEEAIMPPPEEQNLLPTEFQALFNIFEGQGIGAATNLNDDIILFFSSDGEQYAWFEDEEIKRKGRLDDEGGLFEGISFSSIGSASLYTEVRIALFNQSGDTYQWMLIDPERIKGNSAANNLFDFGEDTFALWQWGNDNSCPFERVGALMGFSKEPRGCETVEDDDNFLWMVNPEGDELSRYTLDRADFDEEVELERWRSESTCGGSPEVMPINNIGAACAYEPDGEDYQQLIISKDGTEMTIINGTKGTVSEVYNLK